MCDRGVCLAPELAHGWLDWRIADRRSGPTYHSGGKTGWFAHAVLLRGEVEGILDIARLVWSVEKGITADTLRSERAV